FRCSSVLSAHSVSHVKAMLPRNIMLQPSDQFMLLNRSVQPFPDVMPDRSRLFKMAGIVRFRPFLHERQSEQTEPNCT
ncbi:hypothetical protein, partial [Escherichia coli]|uniref:hypothetical protein n=1 Tax=Escherichia coli TaxID=562 RepID=UPI0032D59EBD